jgi:hypothetical protein
VGAIALGAFLLFFGEFVGGIDSILIVAIPILVLSSLLGLLVTVIGAVGWALRASLLKIVLLGIVLICLGAVSFIIGERMQFGFDDPGVLFMQAATYSPLLVGMLFLICAGIRHWRESAKILKSKI